jgi:hypothetical protein
MATASRLLWSNECTVSGVTITSSAEVTNYPDDNVANTARWKIWRSSTGTGDQWIKFDFGANKTMTAGALVGVSKHTGGSIQFQAHATDIGDGDWGALGSPTVDEAVTISSLTGAGCVFFSSQSLRWVNIFFDNDASANEYVELGCAFAGAYLEPTGYQIREAFDVQRIDPSSIVRALLSSPRPTRTVSRRCSIALGRTRHSGWRFPLPIRISNSTAGLRMSSRHHTAR